MNDLQWSVLTQTGDFPDLKSISNLQTKNKSTYPGFKKDGYRRI